MFPPQARGFAELELGCATSRPVPIDNPAVEKGRPPHFPPRLPGRPQHARIRCSRRNSLVGVRAPHSGQRGQAFGLGRRRRLLPLMRPSLPQCDGTGGRGGERPRPSGRASYLTGLVRILLVEGHHANLTFVRRGELETAARVRHHVGERCSAGEFVAMQGRRLCERGGGQHASPDGAAAARGSHVVVVRVRVARSPAWRGPTRRPRPAARLPTHGRSASPSVARRGLGPGSRRAASRAASPSGASLALAHEHPQSPTHLYASPWHWLNGRPRDRTDCPPERPTPLAGRGPGLCTDESGTTRR
jgi:hypothetical protein